MMIHYQSELFTVFCAGSASDVSSRGRFTDFLTDSEDSGSWTCTLDDLPLVEASPPAEGVADWSAFAATASEVDVVVGAASDDDAGAVADDDDAGSDGRKKSFCM